MAPQSKNASSQQGGGVQKIWTRSHVASGFASTTPAAADADVNPTATCKICALASEGSASLAPTHLKALAICRSMY